MPTMEEQLRAAAVPGLIEEPNLLARLERVERKLDLLTSDEAIGNVLKGPFRLSGPAVILIQDSTYVYAADAESTDTYVISLTPPTLAYVTGQVFYFKANTVNTGAATLNVDGLGAKTIKKLHDQDLANGDIESGQIVAVAYDGTNFQMLSQIAN